MVFAQMPIVHPQKEELSSQSGDEEKLLTTELAVVTGATELATWFSFPNRAGKSLWGSCTCLSEGLI